MGTSLCDVTVISKRQRKIVNMFFLKQDKENVCLTLLPKMHTELHSGLHYKGLFISHQDSYEKEIPVDSISRWIVKTIKLAHSANDVDQVPISINVHEVRAVASSWAWSNKLPLDDVVKVGFWLSENSFIRFYRRDTSVVASSLGLIGPVVATQAVIVPATTNM